MLLIICLLIIYFLYLINNLLHLKRILNLFLLLLLFSNLFSSSSYHLIFFEGLFFLNNLSLFHINFLLLLFFFYLFFDSHWNNLNLFILLSNLIGIISLILSYDLLMIFISLELINLSLYLLIGNYSSGIKYFILSIILSTILLFSFILLYNCYGNLNLDILFSFLPYSFHSFGYSLFLFCLFFKLGIFPFHQWSPDLLSGISLKLMTYLHIFLKFGLLIFFFNIHFFFLSLSPFLLFFGILSMSLISLSLNSQFNILRFLALSSISHLGFLILQFGYSYLFYLYIYFLSSLFFLSLLSHLHSHFLFPFFLSLILFSFSGLPPLPGFYSKLFILIDLLHKDYIFLLFILLLSSLILTANYIHLGLISLSLFKYNLSIISPLFSHFISIFFLLFLSLLF